jgi:RecB family exonuclease
MKEYAEMLEDCLENAMDDEEPDYRHDWEEYPEHEKEKFYRDMANRYSKMRRMGGKY